MAVSKQYRFACARCGSQSVRRHKQKAGWECQTGKHSTPVVRDLKRSTWVHHNRQGRYPLGVVER